jgi:hypothetical protein
MLEVMLIRISNDVHAAPEEHWATLIPDTANKECPRIELRVSRP